MRATIARLLFALVAVMLPRIASASAGCIRRDQAFTEAALLVAFVATAAALVFRRSRIM